MAAPSSDEPSNAEASMPTINEDSVVSSSSEELSATQPTPGHLVPPVPRGDTLSAKTSSATLAPPATDSHVVSTKSSTATLAPEYHAAWPPWPVGGQSPGGAAISTPPAQSQRPSADILAKDPSPHDADAPIADASPQVDTPGDGESGAASPGMGHWAQWGQNGGWANAGAQAAGAGGAWPAWRNAGWTWTANGWTRTASPAIADETEKAQDAGEKELGASTTATPTPAPAPISMQAAAQAQTPAPAQAGNNNADDSEKKNVFGLPDDPKTKFRHFWRILTYSSWLDRLVMAIAAFASICAGVTMPMMNIVFGQVFTSFTSYFQRTGPEMTYEEFEQAANDAFRAQILTCVKYLVYIFVARFVLDYIAYLGFRRSSLRISARLRLEYMKEVFKQPVSILDTVPPGRTAAVITMIAGTLQTGIAESLSTFLQSLTLVVASLVIAFYFHWKLALVLSSGMVFILITYSITTPISVKIMGKVQNVEMQASTIANEVFSSIRMITAYGAAEKMIERYEELIQEGRRRGKKLAPVVACQHAPIFFTIFSTYALAFWYSLKLYRGGEITNPMVLIVVLFSVMMMTTAVGGITNPLSAAARAATCASIFFKIIDMPKPDTSGIKSPDVSAEEDIVLENINFSYPSRPRVRILDNLTVTFPAGKITAIVGPSGSGKSTIVALIERWYELNGDIQLRPMVFWLRNGILTVGNHTLKDIDLKWWRSQIGLVQQEPFLFNDTIFKNVAFGLVGTEWEHVSLSEKKIMVEEACREAFADEFIERLPDSYETTVGDAGIKLSGGQRQRLAIARAIIRRPKILILDEATSAIDVRGEQMVQAALDRASQNRTTIVIAHRLSTVKKADNIVVMRNGQVVEQGTHDSLMATPGGAYWTLATAQQVSMGEDDDASGKTWTHSEISEKKHKSMELDAELDSNFWDAETAISGSRESVAHRERGFFGSFVMLLTEQKHLWRWYILLFAAAIVAGGSTPVQAYLFAQLVGLFQYAGTFYWIQSIADFWCLMFVCLAAAVGISYFALGWSATTMSFRITISYRMEYLRNILSKSAGFFDAEEHSVGALTSALATDPQQLQQLLGMNMAFVIIAMLQVIGCLTISFYFGWKLTLVTVCTTMPIILGAAFFRIRYERSFEQMNNAVFAESAKFATEAIVGFRTVSSLTLEDAICRRYDELLQAHIRSALFKASGSTVVFALSDSIALLCMAFLLWYGGKLMADHEYWPFQYVIIYIAVLQGGMGAGQWLSYSPNIAKATVAANRIIALRKKDHRDGRVVSLDVGDLGLGDRGVKVEFRNVWFKYPTRDVPVLNGLSMRIKKGQFAAVVGPSGSGKTTIISLLERFYQVNAGSIHVNGPNIANLSIHKYREDISLVAQEPCLFDGSIRANILLGRDPQDHNEGSDVKQAEEERMHQACRDAGIHDFIISLPDGYDTLVGNRGVALSGGQKQRLSIARALVRNPRLLLLDEATSNLDSETERAVQAVFEKTKGDRTMIVVAHRLATVQNADVIFVLADGRVVEKGDHVSLLKKRGVYYQMCQSQALDR